MATTARRHTQNHRKDFKTSSSEFTNLNRIQNDSNQNFLLKIIKHIKLEFDF